MLSGEGSLLRGGFVALQARGCYALGGIFGVVLRGDVWYNANVIVLRRNA